MPTIRVTPPGSSFDFGGIGSETEHDEPSWDRIVEYGRDAGPGPLYLVGGEPTRRPDLVVGLQRLTEALPDREIFVVTQGALFATACELASWNCLGASIGVEIVIASTRPAVHDAAFQSAGGLDRALGAFRNLRAAGRSVRLRVLVGKHNVEHLHEIAAHLPDLFPGLRRVAWDVGTLAARAWRTFGVSPGEASGYLESALNLGRQRPLRDAILGMPACAIREAEHAAIESVEPGVYPEACAKCVLRSVCPGLVASWVEAEAIRVEPRLPAAPTPPKYAPRVSKFGAGRVAVAESVSLAAIPAAMSNKDGYDTYLLGFLAHYLREGRRDAEAVLDAMCGMVFPNLGVLRAFFPAAKIVLGMDREISESVRPPQGTCVVRADLHRPLPTSTSYDVITLFKPPGDQGEDALPRILANLALRLRPRGSLLIVLAEHTDVAPLLAIAGNLGLEVERSEANVRRAACEPEHKWVLLCRAGKPLAQTGGEAIPGMGRTNRH